MNMEEKDLKNEEMNEQQAQPTTDQQENAAAHEEETQDENAAAEGDEAQADAAQEETDPVARLEAELKEQKNQYLRLMADFDNYRKNQLRKTNDLLTYGGEEAYKMLLPIVDDLERALAHNEKTDDVVALREGFKLICDKLKSHLEKNGVKEIEASAGTAFDETVHEAITMFPAPDPSLKGKIVDCATKGYKYKDKVIRVAKVVVGE